MLFVVSSALLTVLFEVQHAVCSVFTVSQHPPDNCGHVQVCSRLGEYSKLTYTSKDLKEQIQQTQTITSCMDRDLAW